MSLQQWEAYYRGGALATGPAGADGIYDQEVRLAWVDFFSILPSDSRILDVATGNGVIPLIARAVSAERGFDWEIHASDLALINPPRDVVDGAKRFEGIQFHPGVNTEKLPFADADFDAVSGHYALEYANTAQSLAEIYRVLKPGGDAQFIIHNASSALVRGAQWSLQETDIVLQQTKIYRTLRQLVSIETGSAEMTDRLSKKLVAAIRHLKQSLAQAQQVGAGRVLASVLDAVQRTLAARKETKPSIVAREVERAEQELRSASRRLKDLIKHAQSDDDLAKIRLQASTIGFTQIESLPQYQGGDNLVGTLLLLHRP